MVAVLQVVAVIHAFFGVLWVGGSLYVDVAWYGVWRATRTTGEVRHWQRILHPTGIFLAVSSILVILTGLVYMFLKYGTDFGLIWASGSGRLILISLGLVVVALLVSVLGTNRATVRLVRLELPEDDTAPMPREAKSVMERVMRFSAVGTSLIVVILILMILAATGGV